jgi:pyrroline-5-carboxylate reductase
MLTDLSLAFIGAGVMGEAMIRGLLAQRLVAADAITASHPRPARREELSALFGIRTQAGNRAAAGADIVLLCVKPQILPGVLRELRGAIPTGAFVLSIVAGARIAPIAAELGHRAVVRCMPNTPAQVGEGITVWTATPEVTPAQRAQAQAILRALGKDLPVEDEAFLDMATAISGTGPTYVFLVMEALVDAAVHLGFSRSDARLLVVQTVRGAATVAEQSRLHPAELRNMVTSPGGTSAAALYQLEKGGLRTVLSKAVWAAYQRSVALGRLGEAAMPVEPSLAGEDTPTT